MLSKKVFILQYETYAQRLIMENFEFTLRFDDDKHTLSIENGIPAIEIGPLITSLAEALHLGKDQSFILSEIKGNCYALKFSTNSVTVFEELKVIHRKVSNNEYTGFTSEQKRYVTKLKHVLGGKYYLDAYDTPKDYKVRVREVNLPEVPVCYYEIGSLYGVITSIGGKTLDGKSSISVNQADFKIEINDTQEDQLIQYYKKAKLLLTVKKKINFETDKIVSAQLLDFEIVGTKKFGELAKDLQTNSSLDLFHNIGDSVTAVRKLREDVE